MKYYSAHLYILSYVYPVKSLETTFISRVSTKSKIQ